MAELKGEDVFQTFLNSYANAIDPHTDYLTPRSADNFNLSMSLSLEGIGAVLQKQDDVVAIREIVPGGPAGNSGKVKPGDRVVAVGQGTSGPMEDVIGWRIDDVVAKIRGKKGTSVRLDVIPAEMGLDAPARPCGAGARPACGWRTRPPSPKCWTCPPWTAARPSASA